MILFAGPPAAPKTQALRKDPRVAITIDQGDWPYKTLLLRGQAILDEVQGVAPEYASAAERYFGAEQGAAWVTQVGQMGPTMVRVGVRPEWVGANTPRRRQPGSARSKQWNWASLHRRWALALTRRLQSSGAGCTSDCGCTALCASIPKTGCRSVHAIASTSTSTP